MLGGTKSSTEQVRRSVLITRLSSVPFTMLAADRRAVDRYENPLFNYLLWDVEMSSKLFFWMVAVKFL